MGEVVVPRVQDHPSIPDAPGQEEFAAWIRPHWPAMAGLAERLIGSGYAEDVLQEALKTAWSKRALFDPDRGTARAWLLALVADQARRWQRQAPRMPMLSAGLNEVATVDNVPAHQANQAGQRRTADVAQRVAVIGIYLRGIAHLAQSVLAAQIDGYG